MNTEKVLEVLRRVEWAGGCLQPAYCPCCVSLKSHGHRPNCKLDALLSEGEREKDIELVADAARIVALRHYTGIAPGKAMDDLRDALDILDYGQKIG